MGVQDSWHHRSSHQAQSYWRKQDQDSRTWCPVCPSCFGPFWNEDRTYRGCNPHPLRQHPQEGRSQRRTSLDCYYYYCIVQQPYGETKIKKRKVKKKKKKKKKS